MEQISKVSYLYANQKLQIVYCFLKEALSNYILHEKNTKQYWYLHD